MLHRRCRLWMDCLKNCVIIIPAKLYNQRTNFSHAVELNNKGILHLIFLHLHRRNELSVSRVLIIPRVVRLVTSHFAVLFHPFQSYYFLFSFCMRSLFKKLSRLHSCLSGLREHLSLWQSSRIETIANLIPAFFVSF